MLSRRQLRRTQIFAATVAVLGLAAIGFGIFAERQREAAAQNLVKARQGLARAKGQEGYLANNQGRYDDSLAAFREALQIREDLVKHGLKAPFEDRNIGVNRRDVANALRMKGDIPGAIDEYRSSQQQFDKLHAADPHDEKLRDDLAIDDVGLGELLVLQKDFDGGQTAFEAAIEVLQTLVADDPKTADWPNNLAVAHYDLGLMQLTQGKAADAAGHFAASWELRQELCDRYPQNTSFKLRLLYSDYQLGVSRYQQGDLDGALTALNAAEQLTTLKQVQNAFSAGDMALLQDALKQARADVGARDASPPKP
jgi:tetratricopeptide (TPR) repeat protein